MTEKTKSKLDAKMMVKWEKYVYREVMKGSRRDFRHICEIIESGMFRKEYLNSKMAVWVFILCDGEYGCFDGYTWYEYIPRSLAEFMGDKIVNILQGDEFEEIEGKFYFRVQR